MTTIRIEHCPDYRSPSFPATMLRRAERVRDEMYAMGYVDMCEEAYIDSQGHYTVAYIGTTSSTDHDVLGIEALILMSLLDHDGNVITTADGRPLTLELP